MCQSTHGNPSHGYKAALTPPSFSRLPIMPFIYGMSGWLYLLTDIAVACLAATLSTVAARTPTTRHENLPASR